MLYVTFSLIATSHGFLAFLNTATVLVLDSVPGRLARRGLFWSANRSLTLAALARLAIAAAGKDHWPLGHAVAYFLHAVPLVRLVCEVRLRKRLPELAAAAVLFRPGGSAPSAAGGDYAGAPEAVLLALTGWLGFTIILANFSRLAPSKPLTVFWEVALPSHAASVLAVFATAGLALATAATFAAQEENDRGYLFDSRLRLPTSLALAALAVLLSAALTRWRDEFKHRFDKEWAFRGSEWDDVGFVSVELLFGNGIKCAPPTSRQSPLRGPVADGQVFKSPFSFSTNGIEKVGSAPASPFSFNTNGVK